MRMIYLAGPMTDVPGHNIEKFNRKASELFGDGWVVVNPAEIGDEFGDWDEVNADPERLKKLFHAEWSALAECDAIYLMRGWERSKGSRLELKIALDLGLEIVLEPTNENEREN